MEYEDLLNIYSEQGLQQIFANTSERQYLWQIALPKSGSTWLTKILETVYRREGWCVGKLVPDYHRRNQEIDPRYFFLEGSFNSNVFFGHQHCVYSNYIDYLIKQSQTKCLLQVRNLFDVIISLFDHFKSLLGTDHVEGAVLPAGAEKWSDEMLMEYIISIELPWYLKFIEGWYNSPLMKDGQLLLIKYEALLAAPEATLENILQFAGLTLQQTTVASVINDTSKGYTRLNKGVVGRGRQVLSDQQIEQVYKLAAFCNLDRDFELLQL